MQRFTPSILVIGAVGTVAIASGIAANASGASHPAAGSAPHAASQSSQSSHYATSGQAFGARLKSGSIVQSGDSALTTVGCGVDHVTRRNATAHSDLQQAGVVTGVSTQSQTTRTEAGPRTVTTAHTTGSSLLGGLIHFGDLKSIATARSDEQSPTSATTRFYGLSIGGKSAANDPKPNTTYRLPGLAKVTLNAQHTTDVEGSNRISVNGLDLKMLKNSKFGNKGTHVVIGHATAVLHELTGTPLTGASSGSEVTSNGVVTSNPTYETKLPCGSGDQRVTHHQGAGLHLSKVANSGTVRTSAGGRRGSSPTSSTHATVTDLNLLDGLVTAPVVRAQANATKTEDGVSRTDTGSRIVGLHIDGKAVKSPTTPNTKRTLPGIGTLWFDRVVKSGRSVQVHGVELVLSTARDGYKKGTVFDISNARARVGR
jgi:hypothetical protein